MKQILNQNRLRSRRLLAFTLVELLVVIGIIALLISILLPSLSRAREAANSVACLSNLRQIGLQITMYANDNKDFAPHTGYNDGIINGPAFAGPLTLPAGWAGLLMRSTTSTGMGVGYAESVQPTDPGISDLVSMCLNGQFRVFICPSNIPGTEAARVSYRINGQIVGMRTNGWFGNDADGFYYHKSDAFWPGVIGGAGMGPFKLSQIRNSSGKYLVVENWSTQTYLFDGHDDMVWNYGSRYDDPSFYMSKWMDPSVGFFKAHGANKNVLFADGHAESVPGKEDTAANNRANYDPRW